MGLILACHAAGRIHAVLSDAGGLVGFDGGDNPISQCYSTGVVTPPRMSVV
ncbi:MAG: hypothetical protein GX455_11815 [Phycisphaerae bacterium]|nr:hypothetical protein [Phycisphaerae bacterium]